MAAEEDRDDFPISGYGRRRLLDAGLRLFDERGLDGVSARAISQAAGHRNVAAVSYHFGSIEDLIRAVIERHSQLIDARRHAILDELEGAGRVAPRAALDAIIAPLVAELDHLDGRRYLRIVNQVVNHPVYHAYTSLAFAPSLMRAGAHVAPLLAHLPHARRQHRVANALGYGIFALAEQARLIDAEQPPRERLTADELTAELVVTLEALLGA